MIPRLKELVENCYWGGTHWTQEFRKVCPFILTAASFADLSMSPGSPRPNYYTGDPLTATLFNGDYGIWHGGNVSPKQKYLRKINVMGLTAVVAPSELMLLDYLLFYPLVDMDSTDDQFFDNTVTLPRYVTGEDVQMMLIATNPYIGGAYFNITYTNSEGVSGRVTRPLLSNSYANISTIVHSGPIGYGSFSPFVPLVPGDKGVRSVESITFLSPNGGLAALVLCHTIARCYTRETNAAAEWDFILMKGNLLPEIKDGAYLNFICSSASSAVRGTLHGQIETVWN